MIALLEFVDPKYYLFLPLAATVVLGLRSQRHRIGALLVASWIFFAFLGGAAIFLLLATTLSDYVLGRAMGSTNDARRRKALLMVGITTSLGLLATAKYTTFLLQNVEIIGALLGQPLRLPFGFLIPALAISFYTFESISYLVDVYQRKLPPTESFVEYAAFIAFFPHLVAGPIVRPREFLPQLTERLGFRAANLAPAATYIVYGLVEKLVVADTAGRLADDIFRQASFLNLPPSMAVLGIFAFGVQIYCDFAGYTHIAIGSAKLFNLDLPINFNFPYFATSPREFWRRWHISLSTWLRDYLYVSLGGSHSGRLRLYAALMVTMVLGGLWHGASWTFVLWGVFHGAILVGQRLLAPVGSAFTWVWRPARIAFSWMATQYLVFYGWLLFRAENMDVVLALTPKYLLLQGWTWTLDEGMVPIERLRYMLVVLAAFVVIGIASRFGGGLVTRIERARPLAWGAAMALLLFGLLTFHAGVSSTFIYFQF